MEGNRNLEMFGATINDMDDNLPKSRGRCFDIGTWGGCGVSCAAFIDGECKEPQEISSQEIIDEYGIEDAEILFSKYNCFKKRVHNE